MQEKLNSQEFIAKAKFNSDKLLPAIVQSSKTKEVLMQAWMNEEALIKTIETRLVHYWSRSRQSLWLKGETSGHYQKLVSIALDCDYDSILVIVEQTGVACHKGKMSCFHNLLSDKENLS